MDVDDGALGDADDVAPSSAFAALEDEDLDEEPPEQLVSSPPSKPKKQKKGKKADTTASAFADLMEDDIADEDEATEEVVHVSTRAAGAFDILDDEVMENGALSGGDQSVADSAQSNIFTRNKGKEKSAVKTKEEEELDALMAELDAPKEDPKGRRLLA